MGKKIRIVTQDGCDHCAKVEAFLDDEGVRETLRKEGVSKIELVRSDEDEAQEIYDKLSDNVGNDLIGKAFKPTPVTLIDKGDDEEIVMGYSDSFGRKLAKEIDAESNVLDRIKEISDKTRRFVGLLTGSK